MNIENAKITIACTNCSQDITTTLADLRLWPVLTCVTCGLQITEDFGPILAIAERVRPKDEARNLRDIRLLSDADFIRLPDEGERNIPREQEKGH